MKSFSEKNISRITSPTNEKRRLRAKPLLSLVLVMAMIITLLPAMALPVLAASPEYTITDANVYLKGTNSLSVTLAPGSVTGSTKAVINLEPSGAVSYKVLVNAEASGSQTDADSYIIGTNITKGVAQGAYIHIYALDSDLSVIASYTHALALENINIFAGGDGSSANPFQITTAEQLSKIGVYASMDNPYCFILENDIDLGVDPYNKEKGWEPIKGFVGTFDGNGKTISNLMINRAADDDPVAFVGLFSEIYNVGKSESVIENLAITGANVTGKSSAGVLAGTAADIHVEKVYVTGTVSGQIGVGGLFGMFGASPTTILNCYSLANVSGSGMVGGLVGIIEGSSITNSYAAGTVSIVHGNTDSVGSTGKKYEEFVGGLVGADNPYGYSGNTFTFNFYDSTVSDKTDSVGNTGKSTTEMKTQTTFTDATWSFTDTWVIDAAKNGGYPYLKNVPVVGALVDLPIFNDVTLAFGSVSGATKAVITTEPTGAASYKVLVNGTEKSGCTYIGDDLPSGTSSYTSGADITSGVAANKFLHVYALNSAGKVIACYNGKINLYNINIFSGGDGTLEHPFQITTAEQLVNIGLFTDNNNYEYFTLMNNINLGESAYNDSWPPIMGFRGTLDGNGKTISNLKCSLAQQDSVSLLTSIQGAGLFSAIINGKSPETVIKNLAITGANVVGKNNVGILAGLVYKVHVEKVYVTGNVNGKLNVGGIFGYYGASDKTLENCYSLADVSGSGMVGGLVGRMEGSSIINCYSAGKVSIKNGDTGSVGSTGKENKDFVGGLVGADDPYKHNANTFTSNYYDKEKSGQTDSVGGTGKTTAEMKTQSTFLVGSGDEKWNFSSIWAIDAGTNNGYPYLKVFTPSNSGGNYSPSTPTTPTVVEVNGQKQDAGSSQTTTSGGQTTTTIKVDDTKLDNILEKSGDKPKVTLPGSTGSGSVVGELSGQTVKNMEKKEAVLEIKTDTVSYTLPAAQINIDAVSSQLGSQVALKDIKVSVKIAEPSADTARIVQDTANKNSYQLVVKPVEFEITCTSGGKTVDVSKFNGYVERTVSIPDGVDPSKITTGIVLNSDGTFSHVPTSIVIIGGKYFAKINSLTNSTYSVIYNPVTFSDVANHWAKDAVNNMGSRMVVTGVGNSTYEPDRSITRAEFAAVVVRALGLKKGTTESAFGDVSLSNWFNGYVDTATTYSLITGYDSASYGPNDTITREQAMAIIARAMKLTGLSVSLTDTDVSTLLAKYTDGASVSSYAKGSTAACLKTGIITGTSATTISPNDYVTRAEVAVMVQRLLTKSGLI